MRAIINLVGAGLAAAALANAGPATAQYSPYGYGGYGRSYPPGYGPSYPGAYGGNVQIAVNGCAEAVQERLNPSRYGYGYGYGARSGRVLGISNVDPSDGRGTVTVRGVASSGRNPSYAYGSPDPVDLDWQCTADYRGFVIGLSIQPIRRPYGSQGYGTAPYDDYSEYGYRRY